MVSKSKSRGPPAEHTLVLPRHEALKSDSPVELVDSHTHVLSTYLSYIKSYPDRTHESIQAFVKALLASQDSNKVAAVVDVWCEAPLVANWREIVDSLTELKSEGLSYHFVVGAHPHEAKLYTDQLEQEFQAAHRHPLCVGWGEIGLDYHYDNSPREIQQDVLRRQLRASLASGLGKAITIHTREADDDIYRILTEELRESREVVKLHIHCFTDSPELAEKILAFFPNAYIGITGVITYSSNVNTSNVVRAMGEKSSPSSPEDLRILLETDAPFMIPSNLGPPTSLGMKGGQKMPFSHSAMLPYTAAWIAKVLNEREEGVWSTNDVLAVARDNARRVYGI